MVLALLKLLILLDEGQGSLSGPSVLVDVVGGNALVEGFGQLLRGVELG